MKPQLIVHPVSYSPSGKTALATAIALARVSGAELHVLELTGRRSSHDPVVRPITDVEVEAHLAEFVQSVNSADLNISAVELVGDVVDAVAAYAKSASADLVVVADQARSHGPYWRHGMYANDLARHLSIPLLAVPASRDETLSHVEAIARIVGQSTAAKTSSDVDREIGADVIVVSRSNAHHQVLMDSPLARVLRNASRPVLVLPTTAADRIPIPPETVPRLALVAR